MPKGYVYILTNPSFPKLVKIGRTNNVEARLKQLNNTSVPLPYKLFAVLETEEYLDAEKYVHNEIDILTKSRINKNREFFNISPEKVARIFENFAKILKKIGQETQVVYYNKEENEKLERKKITTLNNSSPESKNKNPIKVAICKKSTQASLHTLDKHLNKCNVRIKRFFEKYIRNFILKMSETIKEEPMKHYIAYKTKSSKNFMCVDIKKDKLLLFLKINPKEIKNIPENCLDVTNLGHYGTGYFEITIKDIRNVVDSEKYIKKAFENISE